MGVPLAIATAVFLNEVGARGPARPDGGDRHERHPAVVAGIFVYSIFILAHVLTYSGFAASLALW